MSAIAFLIYLGLAVVAGAVLGWRMRSADVGFARLHRDALVNDEAARCEDSDYLEVILR